jgi:hypothetical protein
MSEVKQNIPSGEEVAIIYNMDFSIATHFTTIKMTGPKQRLCSSPPEVEVRLETNNLRHTLAVICIQKKQAYSVLCVRQKDVL